MDAIAMNEEVKKYSRWKDYALFTKVRLSSLVIFSALIGYLIGADQVDWLSFSLLAVGGTCITAASNGMNQILERDLDKLMVRTMDRPLPQERMKVNEAWLLAGLLTLGGTLCLWLGTNLLTTVLSLSALVAYTFVYTPLKRKTPLAVFVGAFPGAVPPLLGWTAATGSIGQEAVLLFFLQFMWQFPHFWAIAWRLDEDYRRAGFYLLPFPTGRNRANAFQILLYNMSLIPISLIPYWTGMLGGIATGILVLAAVGFALPAIKLYWSCKNEDARLLMFASFFYLPIIQLTLLFGL